MAGTPTVSTRIGTEGLNLRDVEHVLVADDAESFAQAITHLLTDPGTWQRLARAGREHILSTNGREVMRAQLMKAIDTVLAKKPKKPAPSQPTDTQPRPAYRQLITRVRETARQMTPAGANVAVVSRGDEELTKLDGLRAEHFPQGDDGAYAGHYPADSSAAINHLETLRAKGMEFLLFPSTALWWLEHYADFRRHLDNEYRRVFHQPDIGAIYDLRQPPLRLAMRPSATPPLTTIHHSPVNGSGNGHPSPAKEGVRLIAFYLPQFHPILENDTWWGPGFTEWTNVAKAQPLFPGHYQPHLPADLGFYDLRLAAARQAQTELAREYGIHGFCYYHYWFQGKRLLERPFNEVLESGKPNFPFCLCWANEPWSRRWDGSPHDILQAQTYSEQDDQDHIRWLFPALRDPRAITINGKPVFLVYQAKDLPNAARTTATWRQEVERAGLSGIYLIAVETGKSYRWDAVAAGFDAAVLFQPQFPHLQKTPRIPVSDDRLRVFDYERAWPVLANPEPVAYLRYATVFPSWDNSSRKGAHGWVVHNGSSEAYERWLRKAIADAQKLPAQNQIVFLNAWNEWAEGCHLEPDLRHGRAYLEATRRAIQSLERVATTADTGGDLANRRTLTTANKETEIEWVGR
jgi:hypothetical protein